MDTAETLSDLQSDYQQVSDKPRPEAEKIRNEPHNKELDDQLNDILEDYDKEEIDYETLLSLGGTVELGGLTLPPPSMGVIALLDLIESPFVTSGTKSVSASNIIETLYVMAKGVEAVQPIFESVRMSGELDKLSELADKSPEFYEKYLKFKLAAAKRKAEFDMEVTRFSDQLKVFNIEHAVRTLDTYFAACLAGFDMIPKTGKSKKKDSRSTPTGLRRWWRMFMKLPGMLRRT